jgi:hypothetical protein
MNLSDENNSADIIIQNIENYNISFHNGNMILTRKEKKKEDIFINDFKKSQILSCYINNIKLDLNKYKQVIEYIYDYIDNKDIIFDNTILNIEDGNINDRGFKYIEKYNFSVQGADSNKTLKEIINICSTCNINIKIKIKLENNKIINI